VRITSISGIKVEMKILSNQLKPLFIEAAAAAFPELAEGDLVDAVAVEEPKDPSHGDFACTAPFKLAKKLGKRPEEIGRAITENFPKDYRVGSVEFMAPGFVNLRLSATFLEEELKVLEKGFSVEGDGGERKGPLIVEYSSTNAAKHMGVHHLITTVLGDVLANLFDFMGHEVIRINHLGDWGTNFGKLIYAVETWGNEATIHKNPNDELTKLYVHFNNKAEKHPELNDEARKIFKSLEEGDELREAMWKWIVSESVADLEKSFKRLGVQFDHITGESFYLKMADEVIEEGATKGLFVEGKGGALIFDMGEDIVPAMLRKSDGTTLYLTRDVATVRYRVETWHPEAILYVVDHAQSLHFKQDFAVAKAMGYAEDTRLEHVNFGRMNFSDRAMSTRKGNVIKITDLMDEAAKRAGAMSEERGGDGAAAELLGVSSIKYAILAQDRVKDIVFDWDKIITLEGNSAPYLLYSYARANSILEKVTEGGEVKLSGMPKLTEEAEIAMVRMMLKLPDMLEAALAERKPHIICGFLFEMCHEFNRFYGAMSVANAESEEAKRARLGIVNGFMHTLKSGLSILGIPVLDKM
jgi:arginyl-tRNA synthetase